MSGKVKRLSNDYLGHQGRWFGRPLGVRSWWMIWISLWALTIICWCMWPGKYDHDNYNENIGLWPSGVSTVLSTDRQRASNHIDHIAISTALRNIIVRRGKVWHHLPPHNADHTRKAQKVSITKRLKNFGTARTSGNLEVRSFRYERIFLVLM